MYYGDEIGMHNVPIAPEHVQDPFEKNVPGLGLGRDPERTPMQWDATARAGFTSGAPWLPIADDFGTINVAAAQADPTSILSLYKRLIELRRAEDALSVGDFAHLPAAEDLIAYVRKAGERRLLVILNLGNKTRAFDVGELACSARLLISTHLDRGPEPLANSVALRPDEGLVAELG
jgi:alpha-glucosidase